MPERPQMPSSVAQDRGVLLPVNTETRFSKPDFDAEALELQPRSAELYYSPVSGMEAAVISVGDIRQNLFDLKTGKVDFKDDELQEAQIFIVEKAAVIIEHILSNLPAEVSVDDLKAAVKKHGDSIRIFLDDPKATPDKIKSTNIVLAAVEDALERISYYGDDLKTPLDDESDALTSNAPGADTGERIQNTIQRLNLSQRKLKAMRTEWKKIKDKPFDNTDLHSSQVSARELFSTQIDSGDIQGSVSAEDAAAFAATSLEYIAFSVELKVLKDPSKASGLLDFKSEKMGKFVLARLLESLKPNASQLELLAAAEVYVLHLKKLAKDIPEDSHEGVQLKNELAAANAVARRLAEFNQSFVNSDGYPTSKEHAEKRLNADILQNNTRLVEIPLIKKALRDLRRGGTIVE